MEEAVKVINLVKYYGDVQALREISFTVHEGEIFGLIGPNGAGKTTTLRILATLLKPSSGKALIYGFDVVREADIVRKHISYLPEEAGVYERLTGLEHLKFYARLYAESSRDIEEMVEYGIKLCGLGEKLYERAGTYSKGMKRRLLVAKTLMVKPKVAILDEPTSGLDVAHAYFVRKAIREHARKFKCAMIVSSHNMLEVEFLCDRIAIIDKGRILTIGEPRQLLKQYNARNLEEVFVKVVSRSE